MSGEDVADFYKELREMDALLKTIKKGAKDLAAEGDNNPESEKKKIISKDTFEQRRMSSSSSWARSTTKKEYPMVKRGKVEATSVIDPNRADRYIRTRTPQVSFGNIPTPKSEVKSKADDHFTGDYDIKVDSLSTKKRARVSTISKTSRLDPYGYEHGRVVQPVEKPTDDTVGVDAANQEGKTEEGPDSLLMDIVDNPDDQSTVISNINNNNKDKDLPLKGKAYSFGKNKRFVEDEARPPVPLVSELTAAPTDQEPPQSSGNDKKDNKDIPDVEAAARALLPHTTTAIMGPKPTIKSKESKETDSGALYPGENTTPETPSITALAYRPRTPNITTMHAESKPDRSKATHIDIGLPGPGYYNIPNDSTTKPYKTHTKPVGVIYHENIKLKKKPIKNENKASSYVGPGSYYIENSLNYIQTKQPVLTKMYKSDTKITSQIQRKLYFEQKANDMREVHDNCRETNISQITNRTQNVVFAPPKWTDDPKKERILKEHRINKMRSSSVNKSQNRKVGDLVLGRSFDDLDMLKASSSRGGSAGISGGYVSIDSRKYNAVEKRVPTGAFMKAEVQARRSTTERRQARPGVTSRLAEESEGPLAARRYYGPQIPIAWADDRLPQRGRAKKQAQRSSGVDNTTTTSSGDSGNESPTDDVRRFLAERANMKDPDMLAPDTEYTKAYLKSRYSGSLHPKQPAIIMTKPKPGDNRNTNPNKYTVEEENFEYLGPQLQSDWLENIEKPNLRHKNQAIRMDLIPGREKIKMYQKGMMEIQGFGERVAPVDDLGPGFYNPKSELDVAQAVLHAKGVAFSKAIARKDQVGVYGERPEAAAEAGLVVQEEFGDLYFEERGLDIEYGPAKDKLTEHKRNKGVPLYVKDRHEEPKPAVDDHMGGAWFQGMAEEVNKKPTGAVNFSKMTGRPQVGEDSLEQEVLEEVVGPREGEIDLQIDNYHPNKPASSAGYTMQDPKKYPRFPKEKVPDKAVDPDAPLTPLPNYDYFKAKDPVLVNMDRMRGRQDEDSGLGEAVLAEIEGERIDRAGAQEIAAERDIALQRGSSALSGARRTPHAVDMSKQVGRADGTEEHSGDVLLDALDDQAAARMYDNPELTAPILRNPKDIGRGDGGGARDWSKLPGRGSQEGSGHADAELIGDDLPQREELVLEPLSEVTSKHKRMQSGPGWDMGEGIPRFPGPSEGRVNAEGDLVIEDERLDLEDVDPGKFKKGMHGFNTAITGGVQMSNQLGRSGDAREMEAIKTVGLEQDELILEPGENPRMKRSTAATLGDAHHVLGIEKTLAGQKALKELKVEKEELKLNPTDDYLQKNIHGGKVMQNKAEQNIRKQDVIEAEIRHSHEELKLEPTTADKAIRKNPIMVTSMSNKQLLRESRQELQIEAENRKSATVLDIEPTDNASRFRVTGGTTMTNKMTRVASSAETKAIQDFNLTNTEELKIDPNIQATRVGMPSAATLANKESRIRSSHEDLLDRQYREDQEALDLNPELTAASSRRRIKTAATMSSTQERFPSHKEAIAASEADKHIAPETLILEPTDTTVRKSASAVGFSKQNTGRGGSTTATSNKSNTTATKATTNNRKSTTPATTTSRPTSTSRTRPSTTSTTTSNRPSTAVTTNKLKQPSTSTRPTEDPPDTPVISIPTVGAIAPKTARNKAVYDNLSPNEMLEMIDMQAKMKQLNVKP